MDGVQKGAIVVSLFRYNQTVKDALALDMDNWTCFHMIMLMLI